MATGMVEMATVASEQNNLFNGRDDTANPTSGVFTPMDSANNSSGKTDDANPAACNISQNDLPTADEVSKDDKVSVDSNLQEKPQEPNVNDHRVSEEAGRAFLDLFKELPSRILPDELLERRVTSALDYISFVEEDKPLGWRIKNAKNLSFVFHAYLRLMEAR